MVCPNHPRPSADDLQDILVPAGLVASTWIALHVLPVWFGAILIFPVWATAFMKYGYVMNPHTRAMACTVVSLTIAAALEIVSVMNTKLMTIQLRDQMMFFILFFAAAILYYLTYRTEPGFVETGGSLMMGRVGMASYNLEDAQKRGRICETCRCFRPLRSKHCQVKNRCVRRFDHYCPIFYTTIGEGNFVYFYAFLLVYFIGQVIFLQIAFRALSEASHCHMYGLKAQVFHSSDVVSSSSSSYSPPAANDPTATGSPWTQHQEEEGSTGGEASSSPEATTLHNREEAGFDMCPAHALATFPALIILALLNLPGIIFCGGLAARATVGILGNLTVNEMENWHRYPYLVDGEGQFSNIFDRGVVQNTLDMLGPLRPGDDLIWDQRASKGLEERIKPPALSVSSVLLTLCNLGVNIPFCPACRHRKQKLPTHLTVDEFLARYQSEDQLSQVRESQSGAPVSGFHMIHESQVRTISAKEAEEAGIFLSDVKGYDFDTPQPFADAHQCSGHQSHPKGNKIRPPSSFSNLASIGPDSASSTASTVQLPSGGSDAGNAAHNVASAMSVDDVLALMQRAGKDIHVHHTSGSSIPQGSIQMGPATLIKEVQDPNQPEKIDLPPQLSMPGTRARGVRDVAEGSFPRMPPVTVQLLESEKSLKAGEVSGHSAAQDPENPVDQLLMAKGLLSARPGRINAFVDM